MSIHVLIVDDEEGFGTALARVLGRMGYPSQVAASVDEGIWMAADMRPEVMVVDWMLSSPSNGMDLIQTLRDAGIASRMIMISGYPSPELMRAIKRDGHIWFLAKPFTVDELTGTIDRALADTKPGGSSIPMHF